MSFENTKAQFPVSHIHFEFTVHLIAEDIPLLPSLDNLDCLRVSYDVLINRLNYVPSREFAPITRHFGHPFVQWDETKQCLFTETELRRVHKRFRHPASDKLFNLLQCTDETNANSETRKVLEKITKQGNPCQKHAQRSKRFKFTLRDEKQINNTIFVDIFYINKKPGFHVVDEVTRY